MTGILSNVSRLHFPFFQTLVCNVFLEDLYDMHGPTIAPPGLSYFMKMWKEECRETKVGRVKRFSLCATCSHLRAILTQNARENIDALHISHQRHVHASFITKERRAFQPRNKMAMSAIQQNCSIIAYESDWSAYGLPHCTTITKSVKGLALKARLISVPKHYTVMNRLTLFTLTEKYQNGAIESLRQ